MLILLKRLNCVLYRYSYDMLYNIILILYIRYYTDIHMDTYEFVLSYFNYFIVLSLPIYTLLRSRRTNDYG